MAGPRFLSVLMMMKSSLVRSCLMAYDCTLVMLVERLLFFAFLFISCERSE